MDKEPSDNKAGEDIDNIMVNNFVTEFNKKNKCDMTTSAKAMRRLKTACESAKRTLSASNVANIEIDSLFEGHDFNCQLSRAKFNEKQ